MPRPGSPPPADTIPAVAVEVLLLRLDGAGRLAYRSVRGQWRPPGTPDSLALRLAGIDGPAPEATVSHSTSWRCDEQCRIVLTYAVLPDPDPDRPAVALPPVGVLCSADPLLPSPPGLHLHHVAAHAVRHLGQLAEHDPIVRAAALCRSELWRVVTQLAATMVVGSHEDAHALPAGPRSRRDPGSAGREPHCPRLDSRQASRAAEGAVSPGPQPDGGTDDGRATAAGRHGFG